MLSETRTSTLIDEFKWTLGNTELRYNYTYDELGNISEIKENNTTVASYTYDEQGQLLSETLPQENIKNVYVYDTYGNIRSVKKYDLTANTLLSEDAYGYSNSSWLDRLTAFNGVTIAYDDAGNPLSYYNGSAYTLTWQNGRELTTATKGGVTSSYKYNIDGQRIQKTVGNVVYDYYYADGLLVRQTWGSNYIDFLYDESGVFSFVYNGTQYYYIKNLQGDVVAISNAAGTILVEYIYDAWGDVLSITGTEASTLGAINPIRYRGYYFDTDTEFYYLNSRYYDPEIRRFINADDVSLLGANGDFASFNLYAYCGNNPVLRKDAEGEFWLTATLISAAVGGVISAVADAAVQYVTTGKVDIGQTAIAAASGAISGACALIPGGAVCSTVVSGVINGALNVGSYALNQYRKNETIDTGELLVSAGVGVVSGVVGNVFRFKSTSAMRDTATKLIDKGTNKLMNGVATSTQSTVKRAFQYWDRGISMIYSYANRAGTNSGFGSAVGIVISEVTN